MIILPKPPLIQMVLFIVVTCQGVDKSALNIPFFIWKEKKSVGPRVLFWTSGLLFLDVLIISMFEKEPDYFF